MSKVDDHYSVNGSGINSPNVKKHFSALPRKRNRQEVSVLIQQMNPKDKRHSTEKKLKSTAIMYDGCLEKYYTLYNVTH